jgi:hypothetical protein
LVLFATQLGGGTDINRALAYCCSLSGVRWTRSWCSSAISMKVKPRGDAQARRYVSPLASNDALLALNDDGAPATTT